MTLRDFTAFDRLAGLVVALEPAGTVVYMNRACCKLVGRALDEACGAKLWELMPTVEAAERMKEALAKLHAGEPSRTFRISWPLATGERRSVAFASSLVLENESDQLVFLTGVDVREAPAGIGSDNDSAIAWLQSLLELAPDGIFVADGEGRYTDVNDAGCGLLGYSRDEIIGKSITDLIPPEDAPRLWESRELMLKGGIHVADWTLRRKDGSYVPVEVSAKILPDGRWQGFVRDASERKTSEQERERLLSEIDSERRWLRALLDIAPMGILLVEPGGGLYFNRRCQEILDIHSSPAAGEKPYTAQILYPDERPVPTDRFVISRVLEREQTVLGEEFVVRHEDGSRIPVLVSGAPLRDAEGHVVGGIGVFQDMSERMRAEEALRLSEHRLRVSVQASPAIVFNQDARLRYTWIHNPKQPFTADQVLGKTDFDLIPAADAEAVTRLKQSVIETGVGTRAVVRVTIQSEVLYYDLTIEPLRDGAGRIVGITCATWDVTEQRQIQDDQRLLAEIGTVLVAAPTDYEATLRELARIIVRDRADWCLVDVVRPDGVRHLTVAHSNPSHAELAAKFEALELDQDRPLLMTEPMRARGANLVGDVSPASIESMTEDAEQRRLFRALDMRSLISVPLLVRDRLLGSLAFVSCRESHGFGPRDVRLAEQVARVVALAVDNAQLYQSAQRAIASRDEVLGMVAHDLRSPLSSILMRSELLRRRGGESEGSAEAIRRAALRMNRLIEDMVDVARVEAGALSIKRAAVATRGLLDEVLEMQHDAASQGGLALRLDAGEQLPDAFGDRDRLVQVFDNLIGNAIKFTPQGGTIVIGAAPKRRHVLFWVRDSGPGIAPDQMTHVFDRFWQAKKTDRRGAGLGLPIVKGIIEAHGGRIRVDSQPGHGTTFYFTVPTAPFAETQVQRSP